jgi:hypothetical protein
MCKMQSACTCYCSQEEPLSFETSFELQKQLRGWKERGGKVTASTTSTLNHHIPLSARQVAIWYITYITETCFFTTNPLKTSPFHNKILCLSSINGCLVSSGPCIQRTLPAKFADHLRPILILYSEKPSGPLCFKYSVNLCKTESSHELPLLASDLLLFRLQNIPHIIKTISRHKLHTCFCFL